MTTYIPQVVVADPWLVSLHIDDTSCCSYSNCVQDSEPVLSSVQVDRLISLPLPLWHREYQGAVQSDAEFSVSRTGINFSLELQRAQRPYTGLSLKRSI